MNPFHVWFLLRVAELPITNKKCFARVIATFILLSSTRKPRLPFKLAELLLLTQLIMMMSFSLPWKASTVLTSKSDTLRSS